MEFVDDATGLRL